MKCILVSFFNFSIILCVSAQSNFTFTYSMAQRCKEHDCKLGYNYDTFYFVGSDERRVLKTDPSTVFEIHIAILAASNGHILLSSIPDPDMTDPVYEIVVGGAGNKFTELRRNKRKNAKASTKTVGVLSPIEFRAFYIRISEDGLVEFGREGEALPIIIYHDNDPLTIRYFSFAAWTGVEAKFLYDCPLPGDTSGETPYSEAVEPKLSNSDRLKRILLTDRDSRLRPGTEVTLSVGLQVTSVSYDAVEAKLRTGVSIVMKWTDASMAWNPNKFNGTTHLKFRQGQIWSPSLLVFNSADIGRLDGRVLESITMVNSGDATLHLQTEIESWCYDYTNVLSMWPHDEYKCMILIEPWETHEKLFLTLMDGNSEDMKSFAGLDNIVMNEWEVVTKQNIMNSSTWNDLYLINDNITQQSDRINIQLKLKRRATSLNIVIYTPLVALVTFTLMSFWTEPLKLQRVWFHAGSAIVICMGLCYVDNLMPCHVVPSILILYITVLSGVLLALLTHVMLMTELAERVCKTSVVKNILTSQWLRGLFCLRSIKGAYRYESFNEGYSANDDAEPELLPPRHSVEEMESDKSEYSEKLELAGVLDVLMFFTYSVIFAVMLMLHF